MFMVHTDIITNLFANRNKSPAAVGLLFINKKMNWNKLENINQLAFIDEESKDKKILLFKHSTRCGISSMALDRIERDWKQEDCLKIKPYYLDLLNHRDISNEISSRYNVVHESPQILIIYNGRCIYYKSQSEINYKEIMRSV
jgi:bacillithiol system protein YtxJ